MKTLEKKMILVFIIFFVIGCTDDETFNNDCNQESNNISIVEKGYTTEGFFSDECELFSSDKDAFFVIQSDSNFVTTIKCSEQLPDIDFENYTLLIGQIELTWCCATAIKQEIIRDCDGRKYTYIVELDDPNGKYQALSTFYHWAIISKVPSDYQVSFHLK